MSSLSPVFQVLARHYEKSQVGRTGKGTRDVAVEFEELLQEAACSDGDARELAERQLRACDGKLLALEFAHKRDHSNIYRVRLSPLNEAVFFQYIGRPSPTEQRQQLAQQFRSALTLALPIQWQLGWERFCHTMAEAAENGGSIQPFERYDLAFNTELLTLIPKLLTWNGESLVRFASCQLCQDSKRLEALAEIDREGEFAGKLRGKVGVILEKITQGKVRTLDDLGIVANPRSALLHGPVRLLLDGQWLDLSILQGAFRISWSDIERATQITTTAQRCLTVENETTFHELAKLDSGVLLIQTSYPGAATVALLRKLAAEIIEFWHFGDSDEAGFEILRVLGEKTGRPFRPLHMKRGKIPFEQESLGLPDNEWPFYSQAATG